MVGGWKHQEPSGSPASTPLTSWSKTHWILKHTAVRSSLQDQASADRKTCFLNVFGFRKKKKKWNHYNNIGNLLGEKHLSIFYTSPSPFASHMHLFCLPVNQQQCTLMVAKPVLLLPSHKGDCAFTGCAAFPVHPPALSQSAECWGQSADVLVNMFNFICIPTPTSHTRISTGNYTLGL